MLTNYATKDTSIRICVQSNVIGKSYRRKKDYFCRGAIISIIRNSSEDN